MRYLFSGGLLFCRDNGLALDCFVQFALHDDGRNKEICKECENGTQRADAAGNAFGFGISFNLFAGIVNPVEIIKRNKHAHQQFCCRVSSVRCVWNTVGEFCGFIDPDPEINAKREQEQQNVRCHVFEVIFYIRRLCLVPAF